MKRKLRLGLIGAGRYAQIAHLPTYFESDFAREVELVAVCDRSLERAEQLRRRFGIGKGYADYDEMLRAGTLDAVSVVTPDHTHTPIVLAALQAGCHVLCEKPLAMTVSQCHQIVQAARRNQCRVLTDFHKRLDPCHQEARSRIQRGTLGALQIGHVWMQNAISVPTGAFFESDLPSHSSPVWFLGVHFFDLIRFVTGLNPTHVTATAYRHVLAQRGIDTYDAVKADVLFETGANVSFLLSWNLPDAAPTVTRQGLYLQFSAGDVEIDSSNRGFRQTGPGKYAFVNPMYTRRTDSVVSGYAHESVGQAIRAFRQLVGANAREAYDRQERVRPSGLAGLWATLVGQGIDHALAGGERAADGAVIIGRRAELAAMLRQAVGDKADEYLQHHETLPRDPPTEDE